MKSHELFRKLLEDCNAKQLAGQMGLSTSIIYKWAESSAEGSSGAANPLDRIAQLMKITDPRSIAQWICEQAGGYYVKNPHINRDLNHSVVVASNRIVQEFADMLSLVATAALDNSISETESKEIRHRWEELKSATEHFVISCEEGNFQGLHERARKVRQKV
jgi:transcriptional regulator with XRE-family HTH domain